MIKNKWKRRDLCEGLEDHFVVMEKCSVCDREIPKEELIIIASKKYCEECAQDAGYKRCPQCGKWDPDS